MQDIISPLLVHPDAQQTDGLAFDFFCFPLSSEAVEFDMSVDGN